MSPAIHSTDDNAPMRLAAAVALAFPSGGMRLVYSSDKTRDDVDMPVPVGARDIGLGYGRASIAHEQSLRIHSNS